MPRLRVERTTVRLVLHIQTHRRFRVFTFLSRWLSGLSVNVAKYE
jgi:hypothetical protein